jgi:hypothetical protein
VGVKLKGLICNHGFKFMEQKKKTALIIGLVLGAIALCVICVLFFGIVGLITFGAAPWFELPEQQSVEWSSGDVAQNQQHNSSSNSSGSLVSSVQRAKDKLIETSRKMDGDFVVVMIDIVQSAETGGTPMSICDQRAYEGHFSLETLVAYQKWRSAMLADPNGGVRPNLNLIDTNSTD